MRATIIVKFKGKSSAPTKLFVCEAFRFERETKNASTSKQTGKVLSFQK